MFHLCTEYACKHVLFMCDPTWSRPRTAWDVCLFRQCTLIQWVYIPLFINSLRMAARATTCSLNNCYKLNFIKYNCWWICFIVRLYMAWVIYKCHSKSKTQVKLNSSEITSQFCPCLIHIKNTFSWLKCCLKWKLN